MAQITYEPMTMADLGHRLAHAPSDSQRLRWVLEFIDEHRAAEPDQRTAMLNSAPPSTGHETWDAFLAGLVDHLAYHDDLPQPQWSRDSGVVLDRVWFLPDTPFARAEALARTPAAFRCRGVFVTPDIFRRA